MVTIKMVILDRKFFQITSYSASRHVPRPGTPRKSVNRLLPLLTLVSNNTHIVEITPDLGIS